MAAMAAVAAKAMVEGNGCDEGNEVVDDGNKCRSVGNSSIEGDGGGHCRHKDYGGGLWQHRRLAASAMTKMTTIAAVTFAEAKATVTVKARGRVWH